MKRAPTFKAMLNNDDVTPPMLNPSSWKPARPRPWLVLALLALGGCPGPAPSAAPIGAGGGTSVTTGQGGGSGGGGNAPARCGDGTLASGEACDDGNTTAGDGCDADCAVEPGWSCDGASPTTCDEICGDDRVVGDEQCDGGNTEPGDGCGATCLVEECGNGHIDPGLVCFHPPVAYSGAIEPIAVDLNGDGLLDLLQTGTRWWNEPVLSVRLATTPGVFGAPQSLRDPSYDYYHPAFGRMNGDAHVDIVFTVHDLDSNEIDLSFNDGTGTFATPSFSGIGDMMADGRIFVADLDGMHGDDILMTGCGSGCNVGNNSLRVYLSDGSGGFQTGVDYPAPNSVAMFVQDLNGDAFADVVMAFQGGVGVFSGGGDGTFVGPTVYNYPSALPFYPSGSASGDINGDGELDVAVSSVSTGQVADPPIYVMVGGGNGVFDTGKTVALSTTGGGDSVAMGDVDNDGFDDVLNHDGVDVTWHRADGEGGLLPAETLVSTCSATDGCFMTVADLNADGANDLVVSKDPGDGVWVYLSNP